MNLLDHRCTYCGFVWRSLCHKDAAAIRKAAKVNNGGPVCMLCYHLEMARRVATARGMNFRKVALDWVHEKRLSPDFGKVEARL